MFRLIRNNMNYAITVNIVRALYFITSTTLIIFYLILKKDDPEDFFEIFVMSTIAAFCNYFIAKLAVYFSKPHPTISDYIRHLFLFFAGTFAGYLLNCLLHFYIKNEYIYHVQKNIFICSFIFGSVHYIGFLYHLSSKKRIENSKKMFQIERVKRLTLEKETTLTTLKMLQAQIEPHFLFNTLSNIISLIEIDPFKAKTMLLNLNDYLKISLQITRQEMTTLDQEISLINRYLDIFKTRMGKRLTYEIDETGDFASISFPPMIIQPLVENAIKYGIEPKKEGGHIKIECKTDRNRLTITVSDTGIGLDKMNDIVGIGLNNISSRLENIYGDRAAFTLTENQPSGVKAIIRVIL